MLSGWWALIPAVFAIIPFFLIKRGRWWPGAFGWALVAISIAVMMSDGFKTWAAVGISLLFFGIVLGFAGLMSGPNSPAL